MRLKYIIVVATIFFTLTLVKVGIDYELFSFLKKNDTSFDTVCGDYHVSYIYAPGIFAAEFMMGRYCPSFTAVTGEKVVWNSGGNVIGQPHSTVIFPEIDLNKPTVTTFNPLKAIFNSFKRDFFPLAKRFLEEKYKFSVEDNPACDQSVVNYGFNFGKANIAQKNDINALAQTYEQHLKKYPDTEVVLYGDSRGAATILNFIAQHNPSQVKAAVIEGVFDTIPHVIKHLAYEDKGEIVEGRLHNILSFIARDYHKKGPFPLDFVAKIKNDIPLLLVTSLKDGLIASQCTISLYNMLKKRNHPKVHILILKESWHPTYMIDNVEDKRIYESVVHAFYKRYGLPYNQVKAQEGHSIFLTTKPEIGRLESCYQLPQCSLCC